MPKIIERKTKQTRATVWTPKAWAKRKRPLPKSWTEAAGMLKGKLPTDPVAWQKKIRSEWDER